MDNVRLAFIQLVLRAADLPENLAQAKFILWLRSSGLAAKVDDVLKRQKRELSREVLSLKLSLRSLRHSSMPIRSMPTPQMRRPPSARSSPITPHLP